jgi:7-cyano-7-deazaguanine synthase in queuosine biosynthesis
VPPNGERGKQKMTKTRAMDSGKQKKIKLGQWTRVNKKRLKLGQWTLVFLQLVGETEYNACGLCNNCVNL